MLICPDLWLSQKSPHGPTTKAFNDDYSNTATEGSITPQSLANSPIDFHRQNAQLFDSQQNGTPELLSVAGEDDAGDKTTGARGNGGSRDGSPHGPGMCVYLPSGSDSDMDMDPEDRLRVRTARLLGWRDMQRYNQSYGVGCEPWQHFMRDGLIQHGYALQGGDFVGWPTHSSTCTICHQHLK